MATEQLIALQYGKRMDGAPDNGSIGLELVNEFGIDSGTYLFSLDINNVSLGEGKLYINLKL